MDIENYGIFKEEIPFLNDESSEDNKKYCIQNVTQFLKLIFYHKNPSEDSEECETNSKNIYYRGQANRDWKIECSLFRRNLLKKEDQMLQEIINRRPKDFFYCNNNLDKLVLLQHYGIPTRLLDITLNPLVALFFACDDEKEKNTDGAVYIFEEGFEFDFTSGDIISDFAFFKNEGTYKDFKSNLKKENVLDEDSTIENVLKKKYVLIKPKMNNERIIAQQGLFLCFSNSGLEGNIEDKLQLKKKNFTIEASKKILISREFKNQILEELENIGIKKSILFPELENHVGELIKKFSVNEREKIVSEEKHSTQSDNMSDNLKNDKVVINKKLREINISENAIEKLQPYIEGDFFNFESKKSRARSYIRRSKELSKDEQLKILNVLNEFD